MLQIDPAIQSAYPRLHLQGVPAPAWIDHRSWHLRGVDWQLWVERKGRMTSAKCPLRLEVESRLRSWLSGERVAPPHSHLHRASAHHRGQDPRGAAPACPRARHPHAPARAGPSQIKQACAQPNRSIAPPFQCQRAPPPALRILLPAQPMHLLDRQYAP